MSQRDPLHRHTERGWRVFWTHYKGRDHCFGELWPDRESAEYVADVLRRSGYCMNVRIKQGAAR